MTEDRIWLDVPFAEKDLAKGLGAKWDWAVQRWYAPRQGMQELEPWAALPDVPDVLPGEDRTLGEGLFVDLVPLSCWFTNVRSCVSPGDWERLRRMITRRADQCCEVCGAERSAPDKRWLEAHERWTYDEVAQVQTLKRLICLCTDCHRTTHFGYSGLMGRGEEAFAHLLSITGMYKAEADRHIESAFAVWNARSKLEWELDLSILTDAGITLAQPPGSDKRLSIAEECLGEAETTRE